MNTNSHIGIILFSLIAWPPVGVLLVVGYLVFIMARRTTPPAKTTEQTDEITIDILPAPGQAIAVAKPPQKDASYIPVPRPASAAELFKGFIATGKKQEMTAELYEAVMNRRWRQHCLMNSGPGAGKTVLMEAIRTYFGHNSVLWIGGGTTTAVGFLEALAMGDYKVAIVDEIDKWFAGKKGDATSVLCQWMEEGRVDVHKHRKHFTVDSNALLIAGCNSVDKIPPEVMSRFSGGIFHLPPYTNDELREICVKLFAKPPYDLPTDVCSAIAEEILTLPGRSVRSGRGLAVAARIAIDRGLDGVDRVREKASRLREFGEKDE